MNLNELIKVPFPQKLLKNYSFLMISRRIEVNWFTSIHSQWWGRKLIPKLTGAGGSTLTILAMNFEYYE